MGKDPDKIVGGCLDKTIAVIAVVAVIVFLAIVL